MQSGYLDQLLVQRRSLGEIDLDQLLKLAPALNLYADRTFWYGLSEPLLDLAFGVLFYSGWGMGRWPCFGGEPTGGFFRLWSGVGAIILGRMLTENPPPSQRLVTLTASICFTDCPLPGMAG